VCVCACACVYVCMCVCVCVCVRACVILTQEVGVSLSSLTMLMFMVSTDAFVSQGHLVPQRVMVFWKMMHNVFCCGTDILSKAGYVTTHHTKKTDARMHAHPRKQH